VVRREMRQFESSWFDSSRLKLSQDRINRLGYFTDVNVTTQPVAGTPDQVDVDVAVKEKPTGAITLGAGFSSTDKVVLSAGVSQDNVFGSGTSLAVNVNTSSYYRTLTVTQTDPYFTVDGIQRITSVYYQTSEPLYYSTSSSFGGGGYEVRYPVLGNGYGVLRSGLPAVSPGRGCGYAAGL